MYFNGGSSCGCGCSSFNPGFVQFNPCCNWQGNNNNSNYAIILVLFILLVIVIGSRFTR